MQEEPEEVEEQKVDSPEFRLNEQSSNFQSRPSLRKSIDEIDPEELERMERIMRASK